MNTLTNAIECRFFRIEKRSSGVTVLWLNVPGKVNVLSMAVLYELDAILDRLSSDETLCGLVIASARSNVYIAGADINEIRGLQSEEEEECYLATIKAKRILSRLRTLGVPTVAAINGACKGGGLELAMWCSHRIASDNPEVVLALPEVKLGIMPGFGGCVLLPRLIDTIKAITMIASGVDVGAQEAWQDGLLDEVVAPEQLIEKAEAVALGYKSPSFSFMAMATEVAQRAGALATGKDLVSEDRPQKQKAPFRERAVGALLNVTEPLAADFLSPVRRQIGAVSHGVIGKQVVEQIKKRSKGYSAPAIAAQFALSVLTLPLDKALERESVVFKKLVKSSGAVNLVSLFLDRSNAKKLAGAAVPVEVKELGVIGSGIMGAEIAFQALCAERIEKVVVIDINDAVLEKARQHIEKLMAGLVASGKISKPIDALRLAKLTLSTNYSALVNCDAIVEAVPEKDTIKFDAYSRVDQGMSGRSKPEPWFLFSNTSARDLEKLKAGVANPANYSGMHFFNPVSVMAGVEIPGTKSTSDQTMATAISLVSALGKVPLPCANYPGFVVNAILGPSMVMTLHLLAMGVASSAIDKAMLDFGMPMGPIELMDYVGLDVVASVAASLHAAHGERLALPELNYLQMLIDRGCLGRKSGSGFYEWNGSKTVKDAKTRKPNLGAAYSELRLNSPATARKMSDEAIVKLLVGIMENEAVRLLEAGVVSEPFILDLAFVISTGFPASLGGPLRHIDQLGVKTFYDLSCNIAAASKEPGQSWRKNFEPCALLAAHAKNGTNIYPRPTTV